MLCSELEQIVERIRQRFDIPSVSAAFYMDGHTLTKSIGCGSNTYFAIGSCTKSIVAGAIMALADKNILSADDEATNFLPGYTLNAEGITLRDVLSHRTGLPGCDLTWYSRHDSFTQADMKEVLSHISPTARVGEKFQYNNMVFSLLGTVLENRTGKDWKDGAKELIFNPLGINDAAFSPAEAKQFGDVAVPYVRSECGNVRVPYASIGAAGPAGCLYMTAEELLRWNTLLLKNGMWNGRPVLSEKVISEMTSPQISDECDGRIPELSKAVKHRSYGFGLQPEEFRGEKLVFHGGAIDGFLAEQFILPSKNFAAVLLTNLGGTRAREAFRYAVAGYLLGDTTDWIKAFHELQLKEQKELEDVFQSFTAAENKALYADYFNPLYGALRISEVNGAPMASVGDIAMEMRMIDGGFVLKHPDFGLLMGEAGPNCSVVSIGTDEGVKSEFVRVSL